MVGNRSQNRAQDLPQDVQISDLEIDAKIIENAFDFNEKVIDFGYGF